MKFAPLVEKIVTAASEAQLCAGFIESVGELVGATAGGIDLLDRQLHVVASDCWGLPESFGDRYRQIGSNDDLVSQHMIQQQIPVHNVSLQSPQDWHQSVLYQAVFRPYGLEHGVVAPLIGGGRVMGGIYLLRSDDFPAFNDADLIQLGALCQHLSVRLATLRLAIAPALTHYLTPRELDVAELVAQGLSNRAIALQLHISQDAVKQVLKRMFRKLNVSARAQLVAQLRE